MSTFDHATSFGRHAAAYAKHRPTYPEALYDWLASVSPGRALAVDVATGSGQGALGLAKRFDRVIAIDQSAELLASIPEDPRIERRVGDAEALDVRDADLIAVFQALHWFAGERFYARVRAGLRPGGVFAAATYAWFTVTPAVDAVIQEELLPAIAPHWSERNQLLFQGYRTLAVPMDELAVPPFAIALEWTREELVAYLRTWSAVTRLREVEGRDVLAEIAPVLHDVWPDDGPRAVTMPLAVRAFRA